MGLMQLLTVGRSLSEARDRPHRYKLRSQAWHGRVGRSGESEAGEGQPGVQAMKTSTSAVAEGANVTRAYPGGRWTLKVNPFRSAPSSGSVPDASLQGELVLDNVKPKRNDLSDSDLELVAATLVKPTAGAVETVAPEVPVTKAVSAWARVRELWQRGR